MIKHFDEIENKIGLLEKILLPISSKFNLEHNIRNEGMVFKKD